MLNKIFVSIKTLLIFKGINRLKRKTNSSRKAKNSFQKSKVQSRKLVGDSSFLNSYITKLLGFLKNVPRNYYIYISAFFILIIVVFHINLFLSFKTTPLFLGDNSKVNPIVNTNKINTLFIFYSLSDEDSLAQYQIDYLNLASFDFENQIVKIFNIEPYLTINQSQRLDQILNEVTLKDGKLDTLGQVINTNFGLFFDRYIAINTNDVQSVFNSFSTSISNSSNFSDNDIFQNKKVIDFVVHKTGDYSSRSEFIDATVIRSQIIIDFFNSINILSSYKCMLNQCYQNIRTNLSNTEMIDFINKLANMDKKYLVAQYRDDWIEVLSSVGYRLNSNRVVNDLQEDFKDLNIALEQAEIEIYNATGKSGLASKKAKELRVLGINIVRIGNYPEVETENILYIPEGNPNDYKNTIDAVVRNMQGDVKIDLENYDQNYSGDIILVIGK